MPQPDERLVKLADLYTERNGKYGDAYQSVGKILEVLLPKFNISENDWTRIAMTVFMVVKLQRYCHNFKHEDSLDDLAVYSQLLNYFDEKFPD